MEMSKVSEDRLLFYTKERTVYTRLLRQITRAPTFVIEDPRREIFIQDFNRFVGALVIWGGGVNTGSKFALAAWKGKEKKEGERDHWKVIHLRNPMPDDQFLLTFDAKGLQEHRLYLRIPDPVVQLAVQTANFLFPETLRQPLVNEGLAIIMK